MSKVAKEDPFRASSRSILSSEDDQFRASWNELVLRAKRSTSAENVENVPPKASSLDSDTLIETPPNEPMTMRELEINDSSLLSKLDLKALNLNHTPPKPVTESMVPTQRQDVDGSITPEMVTVPGIPKSITVPRSRASSASTKEPRRHSELVSEVTMSCAGPEVEPRRHSRMETTLVPMMENNEEVNSSSIRPTRSSLRASTLTLDDDDLRQEKDHGSASASVETSRMQAIGSTLVASSSHPTGLVLNAVAEIKKVPVEEETVVSPVQDRYLDDFEDDEAVNHEKIQMEYRDPVAIEQEALRLYQSQPPPGVAAKQEERFISGSDLMKTVKMDQESEEDNDAPSRSLSHTPPLTEVNPNQDALVDSNESMARTPPIVETNFATLEKLETERDLPPYVDQSREPQDKVCLLVEGDGMIVF